ncbi:MAG TPA: amidohydrolase family protein [Patescibacteria group bacterium]|nr:amidohydrolase family protein [Patescibacteria group bacterium]
MTRRMLALLIMGLCLMNAPGAQTTAPAEPRRLVIVAARMFDAKSGAMLTDQAIFIEGEKIVKVSPQPGESRQQKSRIDYPGFGKDVPTLRIRSGTVLPGLIDVHTHLTMDPEFGVWEFLKSYPRQALIGARNARKTLEAGFTSVRNVEAQGFTDVALRDAIDAGDVPGPRMQASGPALSIRGGHGDNNWFPYQYHVEADGAADGIDEVQRKVRENIKFGADLIKIMATGGVLSKGDNPEASQYTQEELKAIVADAHRMGRKVAAHAHGGQGIIWASEAGVDSIEHGSYIDDQGIATMKKNGTYLVPTTFLNDWLLAHTAETRMTPELIEKEKKVAAVMKKNTARAAAAGVKIAYGTDAAVYPHGLNAGQLADYVANLGMKPAFALQTATVNAADLMGWSDRVGSIEAGKLADIIAVDGDPLQDITTMQRVRLVVKGGLVFRNDLPD